MRRSLMVSLALLGMASAPAMAQTCQGLASFTMAPIQVTANGHFTELANRFGATVGYGVPAGVYGSVGVSRTSFDGVDGASMGIAASAGYQMAMGKTRQVQLCPNASVGFGMGPDDEIGGVDGSSRFATVGVAIGTTLDANPRMKIVPTAGLSYAYANTKAEDDTGAELFTISDSYALAQLGVGFVLSSHISIRPSVDIPIALDGSDATFGLTVGYNFGRRH